MIKERPSIARLTAMVLFAFSCVAILLYLWLTFGGAVPLRSEGYRFSVKFPEATQLAQEADVRISGVNVGKVRKKTQDEQTGLTNAELELDSEFAPVPKDTKAILRQKTLLGETYVELTPGRAQLGQRWPTAARWPAARFRPRWSWTRSSAPSTPRRGGASRRGWRSRAAPWTGAAPSSTPRWRP